jgi:hypothetical protein
MGKLTIRSDCDKCAALCCIAYPSDDMPGFAARKESGEPCPKLDACGRCTIYDRRADEGFAGCLGFECFGAGQYVTQALFKGRDWRHDPDLLPSMVERFLAVRPAFDMLYLIDLARKRLKDKAELDELESELVTLVSKRQGAPARREISQIEARLRPVLVELRQAESG